MRTGRDASLTPEQIVGDPEQLANVLRDIVGVLDRQRQRADMIERDLTRVERYLGLVNEGEPHHPDAVSARLDRIERALPAP